MNETFTTEELTLEEREDGDGGRQQLERATRAARVFARGSRARIHARDETELLRELCRIVVRTGGYLQACVGYARDDERQSVEPVAYAGFEPGYLEQKSLSWSARHPSMTGRAIRSGKPYLVRDLLADPECAYLYTRALKRGFHSVISLPITVDGRIVGGFSIYAREADAFDSDEVSLLTALTEDIAYGVAALRREAARRETEIALHRVERARRVLVECGRVLIHTDDESDMLDRVCRIFVETGGYRQAWIGTPTAGSEPAVRRSAHSGYRQGEGPIVTDVREACGSFRGLANRALESGEMQLERDIFSDPAHAPKRARALELGYRASIAFPLKSEGATIGVLVLHAAEDDAFDSSELALLRDVAGEIGFGMGSLRLRASHRQAQTRLAESERRLRETFEQAAVGITRADLDGRITDVNQKFCQLLGYTREQIVGRTVSSLTHPADQGPGARGRARAVEARGGSVVGRKRFVRADGSSVWTRRTMSIACDDAGAPLHVISIVEDISESADADEKYRATFEHAPVGIMHNAADTEAILKVNPKLCEMLGYSEEELLQLNIEDLINPEDLHADRPRYRQQMLDGGLDTYSSERRLRRRDGTPLWVYRTISLVRDASGAPVYFIRMMEDISERKRAWEAVAVERALLRTVVDSIPERIYAKDREGRFQLQNAANARAHGAAHPQELLGKTVFDVFPGEVAMRLEAEDRRIMETGVPVLDRERMTVGPEGDKHWMASSKIPLPDADGNIIGIVGFSRDITDRKKVEQQLQQLAHFDPLTRLPNRASFSERLRESIEHAQVNKWTTGVMFIDLDRFKFVNDTLGHAEGDNLLQQAAERLLRAVRRGDAVGRIGGDEFAVVLTNLAAGEDAEIVALKIVESLSEPFELAGTEVTVSASIGIALCPEHAVDEETLMRLADAAMYQAKAGGRNGYRFHGRQAEPGEP